MRQKNITVDGIVKYTGRIISLFTKTTMLVLSEAVKTQWYIELKVNIGMLIYSQ